MQDRGLNKPFDMEFSCLDDADAPVKVLCVPEGHLGVQTKKTADGKYVLILESHKNYRTPGSSVKTEEWNDATHVLEFIPTSAYQAMLIAGHLLEIANCMTDDVINQLDKIPETIKRAVDSIQEDIE